jgi:outer membrane lipoprotein-sorting protein
LSLYTACHKSYIKICILFCSLFVVGQAEAQDKKAQALLKEVSAKYKGYKTLRADFRYNLQNTAIKWGLSRWAFDKQNKFHVELNGRELFAITSKYGPTIKLQARFN